MVTIEYVSTQEDPIGETLIALCKKCSRGLEYSYVTDSRQ